MANTIDRERPLARYERPPIRLDALPPAAVDPDTKRVPPPRRPATTTAPSGSRQPFTRRAEREPALDRADPSLDQHQRGGWWHQRGACATEARGLSFFRPRGATGRARPCGLSDPAPTEISFERWAGDLEAVAAAVSDKPVTVLGFSQCAAVAIAFAVRRPERVARLLLHSGFARGRLARATTPQERAEAETMCQLAEQGRAKEDGGYRQFFTTQIIAAGTQQQHQWFNELQRISASPEISLRFMRVFNSIDVSELLPQVHCPTLILHSKDDVRVPFDEGRLLASGIPGAEFVPIDGVNHALMSDEPGRRQTLDAIDAFVPSHRPPPERVDSTDSPPANSKSSSSWRREAPTRTSPNGFTCRKRPSAIRCRRSSISSACALGVRRSSSPEAGFGRK
jgi:pimeloyl-ACP methyl ester carboxylesterase